MDSPSGDISQLLHQIVLFLLPPLGCTSALERTQIWFLWSCWWGDPSRPAPSLCRGRAIKCEFCCSGMCSSPRAVLPAGSVAAGCLQGIRMWIHGFLRAVPSAGPRLALQLPERRFSWRSPAPRDTESSRGWEWEGASALEGWLRKVEGETHLLQGPLWELLPLPDQIWQHRGRMGRKADEAQELFQELWERCPSGICHTVTGCCRTRAFTFCFLTPTGKSWSRFGPGRWRERRILCLGEQPSLSPLRHNPVPAMALENSSKCSQDSQDCPKSTLSHFISQN